MSSHSLESIPIEAGQQICQYVDKKNLRNFACASKHCYKLSHVRLFETIHITVQDWKQLREDVNRWRLRLQAAASFKHVRRLEITGRMPHDQNAFCELNMRIDGPTEEVADCNDELAPILYWNSYDADEQPPSLTLKQDIAWQPLAEFIHDLPALVDLIYNCSNQFSPCLLHTLHEKRLRCRLHMKTFYFRSLHQSEIDPHEFALASSPCLHSIVASYPQFDFGDQKDFQRESILRIISNLAPNLKEARFLQNRSYDSPINIPAGPPWPGFSLANVRPGSLDRLEIFSHGGLDKNSLQPFSNYVDFSTLQVLKLHWSKITDDGLSWMIIGCNFLSLTTLVLELEHWPVPDAPTEDVCNTFFRSLPSLKALKVDGYMSPSTVDIILEHHGKVLRQLWLSFDRKDTDCRQVVLKIDQVEKIKRYCPFIEILHIPISRSKGDAQEIAIYKVLGSLQKLQKLTLVLDSANFSFVSSEDDWYSNPIPKDPSFDEFEQEVFLGAHARIGHVRDALINSALDGALAKSIFQMLSTSKSQSSFPLEHLTLISIGGGRFDYLQIPDDLDQVFKCLGRSWQLSRNKRDDSRDQVNASPYPDRRVSTRPHLPLESTTEAVFRRIWPDKKDGGRDWRDDWYSWPLAE